MFLPKQKPVGWTRDAGFQVGARRTFPFALTEVWDFLFSEKGIGLWLGPVDPGQLREGQIFSTPDGAEGKVTVFKLHSHIRLKWQPAGGVDSSILQLRVIPGKEKTTLSFHQEQLRDEAQRATMKAHWKAVLEQIAVAL